MTKLRVVASHSGSPASTATTDRAVANRDRGARAVGRHDLARAVGHAREDRQRREHLGDARAPVRRADPWPVDVDHLDVDAGRDRADRARRSSSRACEPARPRRAGPRRCRRARTPSARGGRFSPRSTTASRVHRARTGRRGRRRAAARRRRPASAPWPRRRRRCRRATPATPRARTSSRRARGRQAPPRSSGARGRRPPAGQRDGVTERRRSSCVPGARRRPAGPRARCRRPRSPRTRRRSRRARRAARCRRRTGHCRARRRGRRPGSTPLSSVARAAAASASRGRRGGRRERPSAASTIGWNPVHRQRCAASAVRTSGRRRPRVTSEQRGEPDQDARRAEPALGRRCGVERRQQGVEPAGSRPSSVVTTRPATRHRRHARHPRLAVDEHRATAALALRGAPVLHVPAAERPEGVEEGRVASAETSEPLRRNETSARGASSRVS